MWSVKERDSWRLPVVKISKMLTFTVETISKYHSLSQSPSRKGWGWDSPVFSCPFFYLDTWGGESYKFRQTPKWGGNLPIALHTNIIIRTRRKVSRRPRRLQNNNSCFSGFVKVNSDCVEFVWAFEQLIQFRGIKTWGWTLTAKSCLFSVPKLVPSIKLAGHVNINRSDASGKRTSIGSSVWSSRLSADCGHCCRISWQTGTRQLILVVTGHTTLPGVL